MNRNREEEQHCIAFMEWCSMQSGVIPELKLIYHVANGGARPAHYRFNNKTKKIDRISVEGAKLKKMGVKPGVLDYHLPVPRVFMGVWKVSLWIEFKCKNGKLTDEQRDFAAAMEQQGHLVVVCFDWEDAKRLVVEYLGFPQAVVINGRKQ